VRERGRERERKREREGKRGRGERGRVSFFIYFIDIAHYDIQSSNNKYFHFVCVYVSIRLQL